MKVAEYKKFTDSSIKNIIIIIIIFIISFSIYTLQQRLVHAVLSQDVMKLKRILEGSGWNINVRYKVRDKPDNW